MSARIAFVDDTTLTALARIVAEGRSSAAALGQALDDELDVLLLGDPSLPTTSAQAHSAGNGPDRTAAAAFLLAVTGTVVVVPVLGGAQHPINIGRTVATLATLHQRRVGVAAWDASVLSLLSRLWESWPLESMLLDVAGARYVDAGHIRRVADPVHPIGGPLTVPVPLSDKPVTLLLGEQQQPGALVDGIDRRVQPSTIPAWTTPGGPGHLADMAHVDGVVRVPGESSRSARSARAVLGLGPSASIADGSEAFPGESALEQP